MEPKKIRNTAKDQTNEERLREMAALGGPGAIYVQEAQGLRELCQSTQIPTKGSTGANEAMLTALGFELGPVTPGDPLFREAKLPKGWRKVPAPDHSMWSWILDDKGRRRFEVFYKAAFYDRGAHMHVTRHAYAYVLKMAIGYLECIELDYKSKTRSSKTTRDQRQAQRFQSRAVLEEEFSGNLERYGCVVPGVTIPTDAKFIRITHSDDDLYKDLLGEPEKSDGEELVIPYEGQTTKR